MSEEEEFCALVTGANSGLGFGICLRLIDEFIHTRPRTQTFTLIITTRDRRKSDETASRVRAHIRALAKRAGKALPGVDSLITRRITLVQELLDLNSLLSVRALAKRLLASRSRIDVLILNAGYGGWSGLNWPMAIWTMVTDFKQASTWPTYKIGAKGLVAEKQLLGQVETERKANSEEPALGKIFCANVFGHYMLAHWLIPMLWRSSDARIIWLSSLEAYAHSFDIGDLQGLTTPEAYESSKRLTDILVLSLELPETEVPVTSFLDSKRTEAGGVESLRERPKMYLCHPGIVATAIFPLPFILNVFMTVAFYLARLVGSMWHTCSVYKAACAPVWLALGDRATLDAMETCERRLKLGSAVDQFGDERVERTHVDKWGYDGTLPKYRRRSTNLKGRRRGAQDVTAGDLQEFKSEAAACWEEMERLRRAWEERLGLSG